MQFNNVTIKGTGSYLPQRILSNKDIERSAPTTDEWIYKNLGISERRIAEVDETVSDIGLEAALKALEDAGIDKEDLDLIIVATSSPERISPSTACSIARKMGIKKAVPAFDINAVCAGFVFGMTIAAQFVSSGMYKNVLLIATEVYSQITDYTHRNCVFFGDGAGAVVLTPSNKGWMYSEIKSHDLGTGMTGFNCPLDRPYTTTPNQVWQAAVGVLPESIRSTLSNSRTNLDEIALFVPHQASSVMLKIIAKEVGLPEDKIKTVMHKYGNIAGASIPIALDEAMKNHEIKKGDRILLTAIGSGWSWGSIVVQYE